MTLIHDALLVVVQAQPLVVDTAVVNDAPAAGADCAVDESVKLQGVPISVTVTVRPAIVKVPVRWLVEVFAATVYAVVPLPLRLLPLVTVIHDALLTAVHAQPVVVPTLVVYDPPLALELTVVGETEKVQAPPPVKLNVLERALRVVPPGPTAATSAV